MSFRTLSLPSLGRVAREFFWVGVGQGVAAFGAVVGVRLLTGKLSPAIYGELALGMTIVTLSQQLVSGPVSQALMRFFSPMQEANKLPAFYGAAKTLVAQSTGGFLAIVIVLVPALWGFGYARWGRIIFVAAILAVFTGFSAALDGIQNAARLRIVVAWHQGIGQWLRFGIAVGLVVSLGSSSTMALLGYTFAAVLILTSQSFFMKRLLLDGNIGVAGRVDVADSLRQMRKYAWPFAGWGLFTWAQLASDRWALQAFGATRDVGLYAALYQVGYYPVVMLAGLAVQLFAPILYSWAGDSIDPARLNRALRLNYLLLWGSLAVTLIGTLVAFLFHAPLFSLVVAPQFRQVSWLLPFLVLCGGLFTCGQIAALAFMIDGRTRLLLGPKIGTSVLCVILNFVGAYVSGLRGVVYANVGFSLVYVIWVLILLWRRVRPEKALDSAGIGVVLGATGPNPV